MVAHSPIAINRVHEVLAREIKQLKDIQEIQIEKELVNVSYLQVKQFYSFKTLKTPPGISAVNKAVNKVASYKINIQNLLVL